MATFGPQMPEVQAHVNVNPGVQDDTLARVVGTAWEVGREAYIGHRQAALVGQESNVDMVQQDDIYGAFEYGPDGTPARLAIDQDLTRIANARRQGRITADMARVRANILVREAINDNPMLAEALQQRANRFFNNELAGGGQGNIGQNILTPTPEEQLDRKIMEDNAMNLAREELKWQQVGMTVEQGRIYEREKLEHERNKQLLESRETLVMPEVTRGAQSLITEAETDMLTTIHGMRAQSGGRLNEAQRDELLQKAILHRNQISSAIGAHAHDVGIENAKKLEDSVQRWFVRVEELVNSGNAEALAEAALQNVEIMSQLNSWGAMPQVMTAFSVSPEFGNWMLQVMGDPRRAELLANLHPQLRAFIEHGVGALQGFDPQAHIAPYMAQAGQHLAGGGPLYPEEMEPGSDPTLEDTADYMAANAVADGQATPTSLERLRNLANDTPASVNAINTNRFRAQMEQNPALRSQAHAVVQNSVRSIERKIATGEYNLDFISAQQGEIPLQGSRHRTGRRTTIEGMVVEPRIERVQTRRGSRTTWQTTHPDMADPREQAQALQSLFTAAELYPDMEINGQPLREYMQGLITGDVGIPWMRDEQIQDVEFNDQRIGGEEGSGVGGIEPGPLMERTSEEEVLANVPPTARAELEQELGDMQVSLNEGIAGIEAAPGTTGTARYNQLVGGGPSGSANLTDMTLQEVMEMQRGMIGEGHMSTAVGKYQFLRQTLNNVAQQMGLDPATTKFTPQVQEDMQNYLINQNTTILRRRNLPATSANLYLMHNLGPQSATRLLRAEPSVGVDEVLSEAEIRNNPALYGRPPNVHTVEEVMRNLERRFEGVPGPDDIERQMASMELVDALSHLGGVGG